MDINLLKKIHNEELTRFIYTPDKEQFDMIDVWPAERDIPDPPEIFRDDCDGFALACRKNCRNKGINDSRLVLCMTELGEGHLVLEVNGFIFDNRCRTVLPRHKFKYTWLTISGYNKYDAWHMLEE